MFRRNHFLILAASPAADAGCLAIRHVLGREDATEFTIDVERRNEASISAVGKAGLSTIAHAGFEVLSTRWRWPHWRSVTAGTQQDLFSE